MKNLRKIEIFLSFPPFYRRKFVTHTLLHLLQKLVILSRKEECISMISIPHHNLQTNSFQRIHIDALDLPVHRSLNDS